MGGGGASSKRQDVRQAVLRASQTRLSCVSEPAFCPPRGRPCEILFQRESSLQKSTQPKCGTAASQKWGHPERRLFGPTFRLIEAQLSVQRALSAKAAGSGTRMFSNELTMDVPNDNDSLSGTWRSAIEGTLLDSGDPLVTGRGQINNCAVFPVPQTMGRSRTCLLTWPCWAVMSAHDITSWGLLEGLQDMYTFLCPISRPAFRPQNFTD